jgi:16S rRNA (uracil1498-N3)-methyltransferase
MRRLLAVRDPNAPENVLLQGGDAHHAVHVLRLRRGDRFIAFDGQGGEWEAQVVSVGDEVVAAVMSERRAIRLPYRLTMYQALPKADKMDQIVRMGTELGVAAFVPVIASRSIKRGSRRDRWRRIAAEAAKQSRRSDVPEVSEPVTFATALERLRVHSTRLVLWEGGGVPIVRALSGRKSVSDIAVFVGPEGGFDAREVDALKSVGTLCDLGPLLLRTETAGVAAAAIVLAWYAAREAREHPLRRPR